jgi:asparagine synthase (glutamine-hydrolysing)
MASAIRHRGPDGYGIYVGKRVGLAHTRLSIIDLIGGAQPLTNEDGQVVIVYNGEVYNYVELQSELEDHGHEFRTHCDTEVLVHAYEQWGTDMLERLNGQFAFMIYNRRTESVFFARDRFGIRPLFYAECARNLYLASEVKAIFASGEVVTTPDFQGLDQIFTFWAARAPRTPFAGVSSLEPGCFGVYRDGNLQIGRYYDLAYSETSDEPADAIGSLDQIMRTGVDLRLRADVPVGGYLSGGLDSSITCALAGEVSPYTLRTFSVSFEDPELDESKYQQDVARDVKSQHAVELISSGLVADSFPDVVYHTETPLVRTAPAPLFLLSRLTRDNGIKVVLTGEGSDEVFLGYDLFKETVVREFCLRQPQSAVRPRLFDRLYPYLGGKDRAGEFWRKFFLSAGTPSDPLFSHLPRFFLTSRIKDFYSGDMQNEVASYDALADLRDNLPPAFNSWSALHRAAYLEMTTLLSPYLLASQGDRMGMAHGIEGRFPFLDHRLFEFTAALPTRSKLRGLREKDVLRRWASDLVPPSVHERPKQPYRAPDIPAFFGPEQPAYVEARLSPEVLARSGVFDPDSVAGLVRRCTAGRATGFRENQAMVAILSTQLWYSRFVESGVRVRGLPLEGADVVMTEDGAA